MNTLSASLLGILVSLCALAVLAWRDPERRRAGGRGGSPAAQSPMLGVGSRRALAAAALAPGAVLIVLGEWAGLTIWAGALLSVGWALAAGLSNARSSWNRNDQTARP